MLINLKDICSIAEQKEMAIAAFNTPSLESVRAAIDAAEESDSPIIIQHAQCHENFVPLDIIGPVMVTLAERSSAQICVHLDHCEDLSYMYRALSLGFTGAMYDGSALPYEVNVENSQRAADMCRDFKSGLECELGSLGAREVSELQEGSNSLSDAAPVYTDPRQAKAFVESSGLDVFACSFGTVHGIYKGSPKLSFDILKEIRKYVRVPLVMHGGSGVSQDDYRQAIKCGIRKINYYTYGAKYAGEAVDSCINEKRMMGDSPLYWHDMTCAAYECLLKDFIKVIGIFAS